MSKHITDFELVEIVSGLIMVPEQAGELEDASNHQRFVESIAGVVADYCGGCVTGVQPASKDGFPLSVSIEQNESLPDSGGIWANYDLEGWTEGPATIAAARAAAHERAALARKTRQAIDRRAGCTASIERGVAR